MGGVTMADNKSCEGKVTTLECMECGFREVFTERQMQFNDGLNCYKCGGPVKPSITRPGEMPNNRRMKEKKRKISRVTNNRYRCIRSSKRLESRPT